MGRPKGGKNRIHTTEYKLNIVNQHLKDHIPFGDLARNENISRGLIVNWCSAYNKNGLDGLKPKKKGNPFAALYASKSLTDEQRLKLENLKLRIENERLKKGYQVKGGGADKEYVSIFEMNTKSSKS